MGTKNNPGDFDCYAACEPDEPYFVLRANDPTSPSSVRGWAWNRIQMIFQGRKPNTPEQWHKVSEALACASAMERWRAARYPDQVAADLVPGEEKKPAAH